ncbi:MAG: Hpt domain-containing protein [Microlunatus sp.]|nr:Hpt domain-containing protein [Microlunatus sp.]MDN5803992.1 Hpt domain-containing protein [Microlunatus sp.]
MITTAVFQTETIESLRHQLGDAGGNLLDELIELYIEQAGDLVGQIEAAAAALDLSHLRALAHKLKGSTATMGGGRLASACERIGVDQPGASVARGAAQEVRAEYESLVQELGKYRLSLAEQSGQPRSG